MLEFEVCGCLVLGHIHGVIDTCLFLLALEAFEIVVSFSVCNRIKRCRRSWSSLEAVLKNGFSHIENVNNYHNLTLEIRVNF